MGAWAHVMSSMRGQWLPGDERGFRDHGHRVHSTGDYRNPPPPGEHAGLRRFARAIAAEPVTLTPAQREIAGAALVEKLTELGVRVAACACGATHAHALIRAGPADAKLLFGRAKQLASLRLTGEIPGKVWGASSNVVRVAGLRHFIAVRAYILRHKAEGAWTWCAPTRAVVGEDPALIELVEGSEGPEA
jgi:riboflavin biosynthesis pyrimidine reductase